ARVGRRCAVRDGNSIPRPGPAAARRGGLPRARPLRVGPAVPAMTGPDSATAVTACGQAANAAAPRLAAATDEAVDAALHGMARLLGEAGPAPPGPHAPPGAPGGAPRPGPRPPARPPPRRGPAPGRRPPRAA